MTTHESIGAGGHDRPWYVFTQLALGLTAVVVDGGMHKRKAALDSKLKGRETENETIPLRKENLQNRVLECVVDGRRK